MNRESEPFWLVADDEDRPSGEIAPGEQAIEVDERNSPLHECTEPFIVPMLRVLAAICIEETPVVARPIIVGSIAGREYRKRQLAQARLEDPLRADKGHAGSTELKSRVEHRPRQHVVMTLDLVLELSLIHI